MLKRIEGTQVEIIWEKVKKDIIKNLPPLVSQSEEGILTALKDERMILWAIYHKDKPEDCLGIIMTTIAKDPFTGDLSLWIIGYVNYGEVPANVWTDVIEEMFKHCVNMKCKKVFGFTDHQQLITLLTSMGADANFRCVYVNIGG